MLRCIPICACIVHVDVRVATDPRSVETMHLDGPQSNRDPRLLIRNNLHVAFLELVLEAAHDSQTHRPGWDRNLGRSPGIEIVRFIGTLGAVKTIIGLHPRVVWRVGSTVLCGNENPRGYGRSLRICDLQAHFSHWL